MKMVPREVERGPTWSVRVFTFGLENFNEEVVDYCQDYDRRGAEAVVPEALLRKALAKRVPVTIHAVCDTRIFSDPGTSNLKGHIGQHPEILYRISSMGSFPGWVEGIKDVVMKTLKSCGEVAVAFYCKSGRHRSVACAWFLEQFCKHEGWKCQVAHLCQSSWKTTCRGECEDCRENSEKIDQREMAKNHAIGWWLRS